jgi:hypothetical protein
MFVALEGDGLTVLAARSSLVQLLRPCNESHVLLLIKTTVTAASCYLPVQGYGNR